MSESTLSVAKRDRAGKGAARAVRRLGFVPGVIYGANKQPLNIQMDPRPLMKALHTGHFYSTVYTLLNEAEKIKEKVLPRDVQFHPVSDAPIHVDFMRLTAGTMVHVNVPVHFINEDKCAGIKQGGVLQIVREEVELVCPAEKIPDELQVDLTHFKIGDAIRYSAATHPEGTHPAIGDRDFVLATVSAPSVAKDEDAAKPAEPTK